MQHNQSSLETLSNRGASTSMKQLRDLDYHTSKSKKKQTQLHGVGKQPRIDTNHKNNFSLKSRTLTKLLEHDNRGS